MTSTLLLDTSSLAYRAFFALPASIADADGRPVNALHGYLDMTSRLIGDRSPDRVVHVLDDDWRPAPRVAAYAGYKAERPDEPEDVARQLALLPRILRAAGMPVAFAAGWEADDAIGVLATEAGDDDRVDIVTGDRDLLQLVRDPVVRVLFTRRGVSQVDVLDEAAVVAAYGVPPDRYVDFAVLRGDPSDGLPGVRGVGEATARRLVESYPDLDALVADADAQTPRLGERLRDAAAYLAAMRAVVPVRTDVAVTVLETARDDTELDRLASESSLEGAVGRLRAALDGQPVPEDA